MSIDTGTITKIEILMAAHLDALKIFKKAEPWKYQIWVGEGGQEAIAAYSPFAFPKYLPPTQAEREGGYALKQIFRFGVLIGTESKEIGIARTGSDTVLGISRLRDIVIEALEGWHPGESIACDPFYYKGDEIEIETSNKMALILFFEANMITN